jgi:hypothetical protein
VTGTETDEKVADEFANAAKRGHRTRSALRLVTVGAFALIVITKRAALASSLTHLGRPDWWWIPVAVAFERVSMGTHSQTQSRGELRMPLYLLNDLPLGLHPMVEERQSRIRLDPRESEVVWTDDRFKVAWNTTVDELRAVIGN